MKQILVVLITFLLVSCSSKATEFTMQDVNILPVPKELSLHKGAFTFTPETQWFVSDSIQKDAAEILLKKFRTVTNFEYNFSDQKTEKNYVIFEEDTNLGKEEYTLEVTEKGVRITSSGRAGYVYAIESLRMLLPKSIESKEQLGSVTDWSIPCVSVNDSPRYPWRGLMLDVVRHFFSKEYIFQTIDIMAMMKMNVLHLHLIDDQGWRLEIKKYPKLTEIGAWRVNQENRHWDARDKNNPNEKGTYGGFYTQEEIKEIVAYAHQYGISVMPEIEIPAHVTSAVASYPELSCKGTPVAVPSGGLWPITDIYCAGKETTFTFLEEVLTETMGLFPDTYIHIGGDEATKTEWEKCPHCQKRMKDEGLKNVGELQSYFIKRIEDFIHSKGRKLIGWDEIIEGGLPARAAVMSWRGMEGGVKAATEGHYVVMTPNVCYLNQYQGVTSMEPLAFGGYVTLKDVYDFDPVTDEIPEEYHSYVLGAQANLWSEFIDNEKLSEYMLYPRVFALAEVLWSPKDKLNWADFIRRQERLAERFDILGYNYATSQYQVLVKAEEENEKIKVRLETQYPNADIRYTLNNEDLSQSQKYEEPFILENSAILRAFIVVGGKPTNQITEEQLQFHKAVGKKVTFANRYHDNYQGQQEKTLTNIIRGTTNFHDKQWLAWLVDDATFTIDLNKIEEISKVTVGSMQNQAQGIYYPTNIAVSLSVDGQHFEKVKDIQIPYERDGYPKLKDFILEFESQKAQFVRISVTNLAHPPKGGDAWMFFDEVLIN